ncbi:MAG: endo alpha-1,4 polygalactosaminidase [Promethearchaeota archaeon]
MKRSIKILLGIIFVIIPVVIGCLFIFLGDLNNTRDYRQDMRNFIQNLSAYAKGMNSSFVIIPQNGQELLTDDGESTGTPMSNYIAAIDGIGREDLFYGYINDDEATPPSERNYMIEFLDIAESNNVEVLVTDYCCTQEFVDNSYSLNAAKNYISFAADHRELDNIPSYPTEPYNEHLMNVVSLGDAKNFLYLINPSSFPSKYDFLNTINVTNYDLIIIDLFYEDEKLNSTEIASLKIKANGGSRLIIAYMSIGEAEDYRYYWQTEWDTNPPFWLAGENPDWPGNYKVRYWETDWQNIIYGNENSYLKKIMDAGFDGVYLDIIDAFEYFENL